MFYQTRQLVSTMDQRFGNHFLTKGQPFSASGVDAEYLLRAKKAVLPDAAAPAAPSVPETTKFLDFVNDPAVPGLDNLLDVQTPTASNDAQSIGMPPTLVQTTDTGTSVQDTAENGAEPAKSDQAADTASEVPAEPMPVPRRTITRRSVNT